MRWPMICALWACAGSEPEQPVPTGTVAPPIGDSTPAEPTAETGAATTGETGQLLPPLPPFEADFLWAPITFDDADDLGFVPGDVPAADQREPGPVALSEVSESVGLALSIAGGNSHGVGIGWVDVDGDGWEDIFVANGTNGVAAYYDSALWHNNGDGTFTDVSLSSGVGPLLTGRDTYSVASADYDADGDLDIYLGAHPHSVLLQNQGDGTLIDVTEAAGALGPESVADLSGSSKIGAWGDYDGDGWLDIAVASSTFLDASANGYLLRNQGDGTFVDVTFDSGLQISPDGNPCAVLWSDYDNDGDQDLHVWNDRGNAQENRTLLRNNGGTWTDVTIAAGLTVDVRNPMGIDAADLDRNGYFDYYISNIGGNALLMGQPGGFFVDFAMSAGVLGEYSWGLGFEDLDADSWWDIFVAEEDSRPYLTFTHNRDTPPTFTRQEWMHIGVGAGHNIPVAFADYDHDFDVDMVSANTAGKRLLLFRNDTDRGTNHFLEVEVASSPEIGEKGGVTGRVVVKVGETVLWRDITGGSSRASQNALTTRFGLGQRTGADWVAVLWPDGRQMAVYNVPGDRRITLSP